MVHLVSWISAGLLSFKSTSSEEAATALAQFGLTDYLCFQSSGNEHGWFHDCFVISAML
jgi:hypothetical protein